MGGASGSDPPRIQAVDTSDNQLLHHGTGFFIAGHGIITSNHVFNTEENEKYGISARFLASPGFDPSKKYEIRKIAESSHFDLAVIECNAPHIATLQISTISPSTLNPVTAAGYPNWERPADSLRVEQGHITQIKTASMIQLIQISTTVFKGNSGGPVLDDNGRVLGVVTYDADGHRLPNSAVAIKHLHDCKPV